jgi:hypothetical protein
MINSLALTPRICNGGSLMTFDILYRPIFAVPGHRLCPHPATGHTRKRQGTFYEHSKQVFILFK